MKKLIIIRGLPGSGKSSFAALFHGAVRYEADDYFTQDGIYTFDRSKLKEAHQHCQNRVREAMQWNVPIIAVSNTAVRRWEMEIYKGLAVAFGYQTFEITMSGPLYPNLHGVPEEVITRMKLTWEQ
jgi:predicted kinase